MLYFRSFHLSFSALHLCTAESIPAQIDWETLVHSNLNLLPTRPSSPNPFRNPSRPIPQHLPSGSNLTTRCLTDGAASSQYSAACGCRDTGCDIDLQLGSAIPKKKLGAEHQNFAAAMSICLSAAIKTHVAHHSRFRCYFVTPAIALKARARTSVPLMILMGGLGTRTTPSLLCPTKRHKSHNKTQGYF